MKPLFALSTLAALMLAACSDADDVAEERVENAAEASAVAAGPTPAALGLTERQLLDADLVGVAGVELGDVTALLRDGGGAIDRLLVEIEDSDPDKFVHVPITGLTTVLDGDDWNIVTTMTREQLNALPAVPLAQQPGAAPAL